MERLTYIETGAVARYAAVWSEVSPVLHRWFEHKHKRSVVARGGVFPCTLAWRVRRCCVVPSELVAAPLNPACMGRIANETT